MIAGTPMRSLPLTPGWPDDLMAHNLFTLSLSNGGPQALPPEITK